MQFQHSMTIDSRSSLQSSLYYGGAKEIFTYDDGTGNLAQINYRYTIIIMGSLARTRARAVES